MCSHDKEERFTVYTRNMMWKKEYNVAMDVLSADCRRQTNCVYVSS